MSFQKIIVIGYPGSGKSTFARALQARTGLPLIYLDMLYWNPDKTTVSGDEFDRRLEAVLKTDRWIIDGNYNRTLKKRIRECDAVFFLDYPPSVCLDGIRARRNRPRPDMPWIETEDDPELIDFVKAFTTDSRPKILTLLEQYAEKEITVFSSREDADRYLREFPGKS